MLNTSQKKAIEIHEGHVCVVAGAGSGKTRVLTERIVSMIRSGINPKGILAFTFTKKASDEMKDRLSSSLSSEHMESMFVGTIHSLFFGVLRDHLADEMEAYSNGFTLIREWQQKKILKEIHDKNHFVSTGMGEKESLYMIGRAKNMGLNSKNLEAHLEENGHTSTMIDYYTECYHQYELAKRKEGLIDFDDMLYLSNAIFTSNPKILSKWQSKYTHISIDEYQDINPIQASLIHMLQEKHQNLFVVGDPKQSIYSFRASDPSFILQFKETYPSAQTVKLSKNYRCGKRIMAKANELISFNPEGESMKAELKVEGEVRFTDRYFTASEEGESIAESIEVYKENGKKWKDFAVLYRCNHQSRAIEDNLIRKGIPYEVIGQGGFYDRAEVKDVISYLKVSTEDKSNLDPKDFSRVVNKPTRYLGAKFVEETFDAMKNYEGISECLDSHRFRTVNSRSISNVYKLNEGLKQLKSMNENPQEAVRHIRQEIGYDYWLINNKLSDDETQTDITSNLSELEASASNFTSVGKMLSYVEDVRRKYANGNGNRVKLMSLHRAKGLEFPIVYMSGMSDALLPHERASNIDEERRLAYVGVTRAKEVLNLSYFESMKNRMAGPSMFLSEMGIQVDPSEEEEIVN